MGIVLFCRWSPVTQHGDRSAACRWEIYLSSIQQSQIGISAMILLKQRCSLRGVYYIYNYIYRYFNTYIHVYIYINNVWIRWNKLSATSVEWRSIEVNIPKWPNISGSGIAIVLALCIGLSFTNYYGISSRPTCLSRAVPERWSASWC
jgi:hypothetical protein